MQFKFTTHSLTVSYYTDTLSSSSKMKLLFLTYKPKDILLSQISRNRLPVQEKVL